jgi:hypothetical protein
LYADRNSATDWNVCAATTGTGKFGDICRVTVPAHAGWFEFAAMVCDLVVPDSGPATAGAIPAAAPSDASGLWMWGKDT